MNSPPPLEPPANLAAAIAAAVQDLVDKTGRSPHEIGLALDAALRRRTFDMDSTDEPGPLRRARTLPSPASIDRRSIENPRQNVSDPIDRAATRGPDGGQPVDELPSEVEAWAHEAAKALNDPHGLLCYLALGRRFSLELLRGTLEVVLNVPEDRIRRSRAALFVAMVQARARHRPPARRPTSAPPGSS